MWQQYDFVTGEKNDVKHKLQTNGSNMKFKPNREYGISEVSVL